MTPFGLCLALLALWQGTAPAPPPQAAGPPRLVYAGSATAYVTGDDPFTVVAVLTNPTQARSAAHRVEFFAASGLEYAGGDTRPAVPELEPGAWHTVRTSMRPSRPDSPLVFGAVSKQEGAAPVYQVQPIHHLESDPGGEAQRVPTAPAGRVRGKRATIETPNLRVAVETTVAGVPILLLSCRTRSGWRRAGAVAPLASVLSAEPWLEPWWETMKAEDMSVSVAPSAVALTISGSVGLRWRATATIALRMGRTAAEVALRLTPNRNVALRAVRLAPMAAGDRSFGAAVSETLPGPAAPGGGVAAVRWGEVTTGVVVDPAHMPAGWSGSFQPIIPGVDYVPLAFEWAPTGQTVAAAQGVALDLRAKLVAMPGTASVQDILRHLPATRPVEIPEPAGVAP